MKYILKPIVRYPYVAIAFILCITIYFGYNLRNLRIDNDINRMIPDDHPVKIAQRDIEKEFGSAEMVMIGVISKNIFNEKILTELKTISKKLKKIKIESDPFIDPDTGVEKTRQKKCIEKVISLSTVPYVEGNEFGMKVTKLMDKIPQDDHEMDRLKKRIFSWDIYEGMMVSSDGTATLIAIEYKSSLSYEERMRMVDAVRDVVDNAEFSADVETCITGLPFVSSMISRNMKMDMAKLLPAVFLVVLCFLGFTMRRVSSVILIFISIGISVVWTMGLIALTGSTLTLISSSIPILIVAVGSAYAIHIINHYTDELAEGCRAVTAVENSVGIVGISVFAAALTTMCGFMSLMTSSLEPIKEFGLFAGIGAGIAFIVTIVLIPSSLVILDRFLTRISKKYNPNKKKNSINLVPFLQRSSLIIKKYNKIVITISTFVTLGALLVSLTIYSDMTPIKYFKSNSEIRKAASLLDEKFMGMTTMVITIEADADDFFVHPGSLRKLDTFKTFIEKNPEVGMVDIFSEYIKRMNYSMNANQDKYNIVPDTKEMISQYLLLYSNPEDLTGVVTTDYRKVRVVIFLKDGSVSVINRINGECMAWLNNAFPGLNITLGGETQIAVVLNDLVVKGQIMSLIFSVITVFIISMIIFRSFFGGFLVIVPLCISVILNFGILGLFRMPLDVGTALIACIGIGIGVDYSIHFINGVRHGMDTTGYKSACSEGIKITGNAIVFNALSVACGFLVLVFSSFVPLVKLGAFIAFTMFTASVGTLFLLPALIASMKPSFLRK